jgi:tetratricopeptide (TPR) repeat protein
MRPIAYFLRGFDSYVGGDLEKARESFQQANDEKAVTGIKGWDILHVFRGNVAGKLARTPKEFDETRELYENVTDEGSPAYPRARLGAAEAMLQNAGAAQGCPGSTESITGLRKVAGIFQELKDHPAGPDLQSVKIKATSSLGKTYLCWHIAASGSSSSEWVPSLDDVREQSNAVIEYQAQVERTRSQDDQPLWLRDLAAQAYMNLAIVAQSDRSLEPEARNAEALGAYDKALELSKHNKIQIAIVDVSKANVYLNRADCRGADRELDNAEVAYGQALGEGSPEEPRYIAWRNVVRTRREQVQCAPAA